MKSSYSGMSDDAAMAFDLRQTNAQIITMHWVRVCNSRENYMEWFKSLRFFYVALKHNVKESRMKDYEQDFKRLRAKVLEIINKHSEIYLGRNNDAKAEWEIQEALFELEERLTDEITQSEMKGAHYADEGL